MLAMSRMTLWLAQRGAGFRVRVGGGAGVEIEVECSRTRRGKQTRVRHCPRRDVKATPHGTTQGRANE